MAKNQYKFKITKCSGGGFQIIKQFRGKKGRGVVSLNGISSKDMDDLFLQWEDLKKDAQNG